MMMYKFELTEKKIDHPLETGVDETGVDAIPFMTKFMHSPGIITLLVRQDSKIPLDA